MFCDIKKILNESDVEQFFVVPLLSSLGIKKEHIFTKNEIKSYSINKGTNKKKYKPDYIIKIQGIPLLIIESKSPDKKIIEEHINEAQLYAHVLNKTYPSNINPVAYCLTTNGKETYLHKWDQKKEILKLGFYEVARNSIKLSSLKRYLSKNTLQKEVRKYLKKDRDDIVLKNYKRYLDRIIKDIQLIDKIFIPLKGKISVSQRPDLAGGWRGIVEFKNQVSEEKNLLQIFDEYNQLIILGRAGAGKTTILERFAYDNAKKILNHQIGARLPVFISVNSFIKKEGMDNLESYICDSLSIDSEQYNKLLSSGKLLIIIDGLNETSDEKREKLVEEIRILSNKDNIGENQIIVSTRHESFYWYPNIAGFQTIEIIELDDVSIKEYLKKRLNKKADICFQELKRYEFIDIIRNPFLLSIMAAVYKENSKIFSNRGMLLKEFVSDALEWEIKKINKSELKNIAFKVLSCLAYLSIENNDFGKINCFVAEELFNNSYKSLNISDGIKLIDASPVEIKKVLLSTTILQEKNGFWEFHHQLIQEYLASEELYRRVHLNIKSFEDYLKEIKWIQASYNAIGIIQIQEARKIIESLIYKNIFIAADLWKYASNSELNDLEPVFISKLSRIIENSNDDEISCMQAIRALGRIGTYKANQVIVKILNEFDDNNHEQRGMLFVAAEIASIFQINEAIDPLIRLSKKESAIQYPKKYTGCLASIRSDILEDRLLYELKNCVKGGSWPSWSVLYLLGKLRTRRALRDLLKVLHKSHQERNDYILSYASYCIYSIDSKIIEEELEKILDSGPEDAWVDKIIYIIGEVKLYRFIPRLINILKKESYKTGSVLAHFAFSALEKIENLDSYLDQLLEMLHSDKRYLRSFSLLLLDRNTSYNAFPEAIKMIKSSNKSVIWAAYDVIMKSKDQKEKVADYIFKDLATGTSFRKKLAAIACGKLEIFDAKSEILDLLKEAYQKLLGLLADEDKNKKEILDLEMTINQLIISLGELKAEESVEFLIGILAEYPSFIFGDYIGKTIKKIESLRYVERLEKLLKIDENRWWVASCASDILIDLSPSNKLEEYVLDLLNTQEYQHIRQACELAKKLFHKDRIINKMFQIIEPLFDIQDFGSLFYIVDTLTEISDISYLQKAENLKKSSKKYISSIGKHIKYNLYVSAGLFPPPQYEIKDL